VADWSSVHAVTVSSGEGLANLVGVLGAALLRSRPVFVPHERIAEQARALGLGEALVAGAGDTEMVDRLVAYFARHDH
jgi:uroporphyrinogen-III synthase